MEGNEELLRLLGLPVFDDARGLAELMHLDERIVALFARHASKGWYYRIYEIPKRSGGKREIMQPGRRLKAIQAWVLRHILDRLSVSEYATAFRRTHGLRSNVNPHLQNRFFLCLDIKEFFPSITFWQVRGIFGMVGYPRRAASLLANLCTCCGRLPQGGVASPSLSNLVASPLDANIAESIGAMNIVYTRYADDMTLSSNNPSALCYVRDVVERIVMRHGFQINEEKTRLLGPRCRCRVTGLVKSSSSPSFGIGRKKKREIRAAMYNLMVKGRSAPEYPSEESLVGWLSFIRSVDRISWKQMDTYYRELLRAAGR